MSQRTHNKQVARAQAKRRADRFHRRQRRSRVIVIVMVVMLVLSLAAAALVTTVVDRDAPDDPDVPDDLAVDNPCPSVDDEAVPTPSSEQYDEPPRTDIDPALSYRATIETTCGTIVLELDPVTAPRTVENFVALAEDGYYEGTPFHRIISEFMIQGGDPTGTGAGDPGYRIEDELEAAEDFEDSDDLVQQLDFCVDSAAGRCVVYPRGTLAMANAGPDTSGSQFFIVQASDGADLPPAFTAFGRVLSGLDVVDDIVGGPVIGDQALEPVVVLSVTIERS